MLREEEYSETFSMRRMLDWEDECCTSIAFEGSLIFPDRPKYISRVDASRTLQPSYTLGVHTRQVHGSRVARMANVEASDDLLQGQGCKRYHYHHLVSDDLRFDSLLILLIQSSLQSVQRSC